MSNELFTDLAIEQQETVSGGNLVLVSPTNLNEFNFAKYNQDMKMVSFGTTATAGPGGASSTKTFSAGQNKIFSYSGDILNFKWY